MKLKDGRITFLVSDEGARIELHDGVAGVQFAEVHLTAEQLCQALSRLARTECEIEVRSLEKVGKTEEIKPLEFPMVTPSYHESAKEEAREMAKRYAEPGWTPDLYFGSRESFFKRGDVQMARTSQRRWV